MSSNSTDSVMGVGGILEPQELRRSARLAAKPQKCYKIEDPYDSEDLPDDAELEDEMDKTYVEDAGHIMDINELFRDVLKKNYKVYKITDGFTDENIDEAVKIFEEYYEANKETKYVKWWVFSCINNITRYYPKKIRCVISSYIYYSKKYASEPYTKLKNNTFYNPILHRLYFNILYRRIMKKELNKLNIEYDERLMDIFWNWYNNPDNYKSVKCTYTYGPTDIVRTYITTVPKSCNMNRNIVREYISSTTTVCSNNKEQDDMMSTFRDVIQEYGYELTADDFKKAVMEFQEYYEKHKNDKNNSILWRNRYDWINEDYITVDEKHPLKGNIINYIESNKYWAKRRDYLNINPTEYVNNILQQAITNYTYKKVIKKEVAKISLEYNEEMLDDFKKWRSDHNNRKYIRSNPDTVRSYLKTLPKRFIF